MCNRARLQIPKIRPLPKEIPRRGHPGVPYLQYSMRLLGVRAGEGLGGGGPRGNSLSLRGGSLQGLFFGESLHDLRLQEDCDWKRAAQKLKRLPCVKGAVSEAD